VVWKVAPRARRSGFRGKPERWAPMTARVRVSEGLGSMFVVVVEGIGFIVVVGWIGSFEEDNGSPVRADPSSGRVWFQETAGIRFFLLELLRDVRWEVIGINLKSIGVLC
jgi:hypothetical protein